MKLIIVIIIIIIIIMITVEGETLPLANLPLNCYLTVLLTTLSAWKEYSISNFLALLSHMISVGKLTLTR